MSTTSPLHSSVLVVNSARVALGTISQSTFNTKLPLVFKRFHNLGDSDKDFLSLISEVLILSPPPIQSHLNIVNLEGICQEIIPRTGRAVPVLVFEKVV